MTTDMQKHLARQEADEDVPQAFRDHPLLVDLTNDVDGSPCFGVAVTTVHGYAPETLWVRVWVQPIAVDERAEPDKVRFLVDLAELADGLLDYELERVPRAIGRYQLDDRQYHLETTVAEQAIDCALAIARLVQAVL